jgi:membrane-associated protein
VDVGATLQWLQETHPYLGVLALGASALVEYVFPPFPGDTVIIAGAVMVGAFGFPLVPVFLAVLVGSTLGAAADFWIGRLVARGRGGRVQRMWIVRHAFDGADRFSRAFARYGEGVIAINRFLPGVRAFLFVAAGMGGMRFWRVMLWATVSNVVYTAALFLAGTFVGANLDTLAAWVRQAGLWAWAIVLAAVAVGVGAWAWKRRRR